MLDVLLKQLNRLCPEACPRCGLRSAIGFCKDCRRDFTRIESPCLRCAMPGPMCACPAACSTWPVDAIRAPFRYEPPLAHYLRALKYRRQRLLGRALGDLLGDAIETVSPAVDAIVSVPLHARRLRSRGFNQADEIAVSLKSRLAKPQLIAGISRRLETRPQTDLDRLERLSGPAGSFTVARSLAGLRLAIVDDVITTGATVNALAGELKAAGADWIEAWSVARSVGARAGDGYST